MNDNEYGAARGSAGAGVRRPAATMMLQGTASDVGKSLLTAAFCRILKQDGKRVAPFKSQNMSLNSYVTPDGKEIGRAQGMQADACGIAATTDMNPILLKPKKDMVSQVVVHGKPFADFDAREYRERYLPKAGVIVREALARLRDSYDVVVLEGAGSPAEVNLKDRDIVNMRLAGWADAPVLLVADIDRGGVFASVVGTMEILEPGERDRVKGIIINKFRGDVSLLTPGLEWLERRIGKPVLGVVPYLEGLQLEDEDGASLDARGRRTRAAANDELDIAVIRLPRISNFTDFDPLQQEPGVVLRYVRDVREWGEPDIVLIPGSKNTVEDLLFLRESGLEALLLKHIKAGGRAAGICAGYQMMGERLLDPDGVESDLPELAGLALFPMETMFAKEKTTERVTGSVMTGFGEAAAVEGYEIHMGRTAFTESVAQPFRIRPSRLKDEPESYHPDGVVSRDGRIWGTYIHHIFHNDRFRHNWLNDARQSKGLPLSGEETPFGRLRELSFDRLADHVRKHVDMAAIYEMINEGSNDERFR
ncbi:cobyric acid synthase [Paenibacillus harenae]|uniref:cobyric acid synthase n=1 Tax=Paenibacillus harenae TaxID=306543 RepID=UPI002791AED6|nr:cobyric acid synthase [Paenibacillus harenae]MDQ0062140.1 adenosylcobyric acid synthase [Paenibacillus harenae]